MGLRSVVIWSPECIRSHAWLFLENEGIYHSETDRKDAEMSTHKEHLQIYLSAAKTTDNKQHLQERTSHTAPQDTSSVLHLSPPAQLFLPQFLSVILSLLDLPSILSSIHSSYFSFFFHPPPPQHMHQAPLLLNTIDLPSLTNAWINLTNHRRLAKHQAININGWPCHIAVLGSVSDKCFIGGFDHPSNTQKNLHWPNEKRPLFSWFSWCKTIKP